MEIYIYVSKSAMDKIRNPANRKDELSLSKRILNDKNINTDFYNRVVELLKEARKSVIQTVNKTMVYTYFEIGRIIVEEEQKGKARAEYGKQILKGLSGRLSKEFDKGFYVDNLENMKIESQCTNSTFGFLPTHRQTQQRKCRRV